MPYSKRISIRIARHEALAASDVSLPPLLLVRYVLSVVNKRHESLLLAQSCNLPPLVFRWIAARGVVGTSLQHYDISGFGLALQGRIHALEIKCLGARIEVRVQPLSNALTGLFPDGGMVDPAVRSL